MSIGRTFIATIVSAMSLFAVAPAHAQTADELKALRSEIEALKKGQAAIRNDLRTIRMLLQRVARPSRPRVAEAFSRVLRGVADDPTIGDEHAKLMMVEFSDYQCPFCQRHAMTTMAQLKKEYLSTGKVKYVFRDFPITSIHPHAFKAAEAANCAGDQGKYWEMHELLFRNARRLTEAQLPGYAGSLSLDMAAFNQCMESDKYKAEVEQDITDGRAAGVTGTPAFFLAVVGDEPGTFRTLTKIRGAQPFRVLKPIIDTALADLARAAKAKTDR